MNMDTLTIGKLNEKISELRSKIAVTEGVVLYLKTHYMPAENSSAEMHFTRSDFGLVPKEHVDSTIADYVEYLDSLKIELRNWENTPIHLPKPAQLTAGPEEKTAEVPEEKPKKPAVRAVKSSKEAPSAAQSGNQDQPPAPRQAAGGKTG